jgi:hypothetical protein
MTRAKNDEDRLRFVIDAIEASILSSTEDEIAEDVCYNGQDPHEIGESMRALIRTQIKVARQTSLRAAQKGCRHASMRIQKAAAIPSDPHERRSLLSRLMTVGGDFPREMTLAFRDGKSISDEDVASMLADLAELGLIDDGHEK